ncbi:myosin light chain kinase 3 isoform X1 [Scyliorhinus canicula]|uniref:myosin light chain kinase 3 isoform X1 n=1 Tax=Scyliorhinus canicula TaxID=7830 RepID=UPI0018F71D71|nr:myosin light chain kinase 3 isoform X1 [Scyliorhinus canicula]
MSKPVSLASCLARMYEGTNLESQNKSGPVGQVKKPSGANQSSIANNLSTMDSKLNLLNEKVDRIVNFQGQVLKKLDDMSQGMGGLERNIEILKTVQDTDGVADQVKSDVKCSQNTDCLSHAEIKPLFMELFKLVTSVHQDTAGQKEKLDGIERKMSAVDKTIHFVGETFKNSHIVQFILKGIVPWKKGNLIDSSEANNKAEEKGAKPKHGFSNRGVQVQINREVFADDNDCKDTQTCGNVQKHKDEHTKSDSVIQIEPQATFHSEGGTSLNQSPGTADKHEDPRGVSVLTNKCGGASKKEISAVTRRVKEAPQENTENTQSQNSSEDNLKEMTKTSTDNEADNTQGVERSHEKETDKIKLTVTTGAPKVSAPETQSKLDGNSKNLPERPSETIHGIPIIPAEKADSESTATKVLVPTTCEGPKEPQKKHKAQQKPKEDTSVTVLHKTAKEKEPGTAPDVRVNKLAKPAVTHEKALKTIKPQTGQKSEKTAQSCQNKVENKCKSDIGSESKSPKEVQKASKEPEKITEVADLAKSETGSAEITNKAQENQGPVEKPKDQNIIIDDDPSPPAPFSHRIVTTKQVLVTSSYTVHHDEVLGGGRFGQVLKCAEKSTGLELAAKIIKVKGPKDREEVKNEITVMNQLSHVNLIQLYDAFEAKNNVTLIMEYVGGGELFDRIIDENYNLTELDTIIFVKQICEGVQYLHQQYVLHLDLKPENILCVNNTGNQIKIIDFGLARRYKPREKLKVNFGTPEFLAPEVVNYDYVSFSTDMWSVGVITYMLVSGLSPFLGDHDTETMNNVINANWDFDAEGFENVSEEAKEFVSNLIVKEMSSRFSAAQCLKHSWLNDLPDKAKKCRVRLRSQVMLRKYIAQRLWKKNIYAVTAVNRLRKLNQQKVA